MNNDLISRSALLKTIKEKVRPDKYGKDSQVLNTMGTVIHTIRAQPAVCPENKKPEAGNKRAYSFDNEDYSGVYDTDDEALHDALMEIEYIRKHEPKCTPGLVYIGTCEFFKPSLSGSSWDIIEAVLQQADDEGFEEWTDGYLSDIPIEQREELEESLEKVFQEWIDKYNYHATFFIVTSYDVYSYDKDKHELFREARASAECPRNIHLWHIGRDSNSRPVYKDEQEKFWKDVNPRADCPAKLCSALDNAFDGEPDTPMEYMERYQNVKIHFIPKRDTW